MDSNVTKKRNLACFIYHLPNPLDYGIKTHSEALAFMKELGFNTPEAAYSALLQIKNIIDKHNTYINTAD